MGRYPTEGSAWEWSGQWLPGTRPFWLNWTKFDYLYLLFTDDDAPNPDPSRLQLVADGDGFQLYRIMRPEFARAGP